MYYCITNPRVFYIIQVLIDSKVVRSGAKQTTTTKKNIMFDQYNNLDFGIEEDASNLPLIFCPSPGTLSWQDQCLSDHDGILSTVSKNVANYSTAVHGENVETMHDDSNNNNNNEPDPAHIVSKKLFCFADGHILDPHHVDLFCLDLLKRTYQLTIHRHNESDSFSLTKGTAISIRLLHFI